MYYRRKILLATLQAFGGTLQNTQLQKVLFLISRKQTKKSFDFVPYRYGSFSFQANQDLHTLIKYGLVTSQAVEHGQQWQNVEPSNFLAEIEPEDRKYILEIVAQTQTMSRKELIRYTYQKFPYYATKSQIATELLTEEELKPILSQKRTFEESCLLSIGYEGLSLEAYLNKLILNDVRLLCDVRKNAMSMKYGFSKKQLQTGCEGVGIAYVHMPELGIDSDKRTELNVMADYEKLFAAYEKTTLQENVDGLEKVEALLKKYNRVALTCFEKDQCMCHRGRIVKRLSQSDHWNIPIKHL
jgi:uncharacterized protein (DUF488 family)